jgi:hypothetical protein
MIGARRPREFAMPGRLLLLCLLALPAVALADAANGQFMGFKLGDDYPQAPEGSVSTTTGNLLILADDPVKPAGIQQVNLVVTPMSLTIGQIIASSWYDTEAQAREAGRHFAELLRVKYPDWTFEGEVMDGNMRIVEVRLEKVPHSVKLRLVEEEHDGRDMWRFSMSLGWQPNTKGRLAWQNMAASQQAERRAAAREKLLKDPDLRGL